MNQEIFEWKDDYNLNVKVLDDAHKQLFSIVGRIIRNFTDNNFEKNKMTCIEAVKYLKNYSLKHFAEEEAYQLSIGYSGYKIHKKVHDNMREIVIPALDREMTASDYSIESIEHFVGVCAGWLAAHIMIDDQAIVGKAQSKWIQNPDDNESTMLNQIGKSFINGLFQAPASLVSKNYTGHELSKLFCYSDKFTDKFGNVYTVTTAIEEIMVEKVLTNIMNTSVFALSDVMLPMITEIVKSFNTNTIRAFVSEELTNTNSIYVKSKDFYASFEKAYPDYSMLWRTMYGYIALCIRKESVISQTV